MRLRIAYAINEIEFISEVMDGSIRQCDDESNADPNG